MGEGLEHCQHSGGADELESSPAVSLWENAKVTMSNASHSVQSGQFQTSMVYRIVLPFKANADDVYTYFSVFLVSEAIIGRAPYRYNFVRGRRTGDAITEMRNSDMKSKLSPAYRRRGCVTFLDYIYHAETEFTQHLVLTSRLLLINNAWDRYIEIAERTRVGAVGLDVEKGGKVKEWVSSAFSLLSFLAQVTSRCKNLVNLNLNMTHCKCYRNIRYSRYLAPVLSHRCSS